MNYTIIISLIIILTGIFFRILPYDSVQGLWNDEYVGWFISQKPLFSEFIQGIFSQCHMPLYYCFLKIITKIFGNNDIILRLSSTIIGLCSILVMYKIGKEKDENLGLICAFFTSISGFLIYFSYEVRPYSLIFLFSALSLLYTIRLLKITNKKNTYGYIISNLLIILTHTIGFVYVFFNLICVSYFLKEKNTKITKVILISTLIGFLFTTPLLHKIATTTSFSQWWTSFSFSKILFMQTDFFSNYLVNIINAPKSFIGAIGWFFLAFGIIPATICITGFLNSLFIKYEYTKSLALIAISTTTILFIASMTGKIAFITKYNIEVYPILIYLSMYGLYAFKNKLIKILIFILIFSINSTFLFTANFKSKFIKNESNKLVAELLENTKLHENDFIILNYYPKERFEKYYDFTNKNVFELHKGNFNFFLTPDTSYNDAVKNGKTIYKEIYLNNDNDYFDSIITRDVINRMKSGDKLAIVFLNSVAFLSDVQNFRIAIDDKKYKQTQEIYMLFSYIKNRVLKVSMQSLDLIRYEQSGDWTVATFRKN